MSEREQIIEMLKPLMEKARKEQLWFYCAYQGMWFSPDRMQKEWDNGHLIWGPVNWQLRDPKEKLAQTRRELNRAQAEFDRIQREVTSGKTKA